VTVLVSVLVLMLVLTLVDGGVVVVVVVVVGGVVVVVVVVASVVVGVSVTVTVSGADVVVGATDRDVVVSGVNVVCSEGASSPPVMSLANPNTISAMITTPRAPRPTSAAGLRNHGTSSPGPLGGPGGSSYPPPP
jgi:hypothetical protein